jgi:hypothetical protein
MGILKVYNISEINSKRLTDDIKASGSVNGYEHIIHADGMVRVYGQSIQDETALNNIFSSHVAFILNDYKAERMLGIDARTAELIGEGYTYGAKQFSLSIHAQTNILALFATKDNPALGYPIKYNTKDDTDTLELLNAADVEGMYLSALAAKKGHLDSGTSLKDSIRDATTKEEVDAIIDNR